MAMNTRSVQRALNSMMGGRGGTHPQNGDYVNREPVMRIGVEYQAQVPELNQSARGDGLQGVGSIMVWCPCCQEKDDEYLKMAKDKCAYGVEQALGLLYWHKYDIRKATEDLTNFCPLQDEWSMEDQVTFEQGFQYHGKNFQRIKAMLPDKPISSLVKHYYLRKKSYSQYSLMDRHARKNWKRMSTGLPLSNDDTDSSKSGSSRSDTFSAPLPILLPPTSSGGSAGKGKQLPKGIYLSTADLSTLANDTLHSHLHQLDQEVTGLRDRIQASKQEVDGMNGKDELEMFRPTEFSKKTGTIIPAKWSEEEVQICLDVISKHGKNYEALFNALEGKTVQQCKNFFTNYKRKLNLPRLIAEFEISHGQKISRYSRQAHDLVENGGSSLGEDELVSEIILGPEHKRQRLMNRVSDDVNMSPVALKLAQQGE